MLNHTPVWKATLVFLVVAFFTLYASPNLYGEDPAVQISAERTAPVDTNLLDQVQSILAERNIATKSVALEDQKILVRLADNDTQLQAQEALDIALSDDYIAAINLAPATPEWLKSLGASPMKLGLDLRGGVYFLMEVDMDTALNTKLEDTVSDFRTALREENIRYRRVVKEGNVVEIQFRDEATKDEAKFFLRNSRGDWQYSDQDDLTLVAQMSEQTLAETKDYAIKQNITIMRNRVNQLGVAEPVIQRQGPDRIVVQLPGIQDTARAKQILNATATIELRMVDQDNDLNSAISGRVPAGSQLIEDENGTPVLLKKRVMLTGNHIVDANSGVDEYGRPQVSISLDSEGGSKMTRGTRDNVGKPMATVFIEYEPTRERTAEGKLKFEKKERVISVATIQAVLGSSFRITGLDTPGEARNLALLLRAGALIAPIQIVEERTVGPSLGQQNISQGTDAIVLGFVIVLAFMLIYYKGFGVVANVALAANLILIIGVMSLIPGATLTLPGMAGIVLTVGMAVDANVLIFERIREELRDGRSPQQSIHHGYDSAFSTILDANITTLIAALILFAVGTGPIKGFSVTLMVGIVTSMFTAIILTRAIVNSIWGGKRLSKLSI
ncbi:protein translocase subunit SecD [Planctobacterium marinum]|uniref:protein translocase subunit SecD n=1 Tax=Planctobacterium marinum TaxID=1631968 RepID=UPI001E5B2B01|nr:protein translocase subunit SecD [Planctobacterium marinum]MCC2606322.1 protein translocase subunit SecD [Planctobacterium marinum]